MEPMVAPVLSFTGSPALSVAAAPAVALVFAPDVLADGAFVPDGMLLEGMLEDGMLSLPDGIELWGIEDEPVGGVAPWVWATAWPAIARAIPAATKGETERMKISLSASPR